MTTQYFFENRTQYLRFKIAWSEAVNSPRAKSSLEPCDEWIGGSYGRVSKGTGVFRRTGWINAGHHILYNIIRGKSLDLGFTPITNKNRLENGTVPDLGFRQALFALEYIIKMAKTENPSEYRKKAVAEFLEPFRPVLDQEVFTKEMLASLVIPKDEMKEAA